MQVGISAPTALVTAALPTWFKAPAMGTMLEDIHQQQNCLRLVWVACTADFSSPDRLRHYLLLLLQHFSLCAACFDAVALLCLALLHPGKTTLMDVICGRKTVGRTTGRLMINGRRLVKAPWSRVVGYVEQMDVHTAAQTVTEALWFSGRLRLGRKFSDQQVSKQYMEWSAARCSASPVGGRNCCLASFVAMVRGISDEVCRIDCGFESNPLDFAFPLMALLGGSSDACNLLMVTPVCCRFGTMYSR